MALKQLPQRCLGRNMNQEVPKCWIKPRKAPPPVQSVSNQVSQTPSGSQRPVSFVVESQIVSSLEQSPSCAASAIKHPARQWRYTNTKQQQQRNPHPHPSSSSRSSSTSNLGRCLLLRVQWRLAAALQNATRRQFFHLRTLSRRLNLAGTCVHTQSAAAQGLTAFAGPILGIFLGIGNMKSCPRRNKAIAIYLDSHHLLPENL